MKTNNKYTYVKVYILLLALHLSSCAQRILWCPCDDYKNQDSLIERILTVYDIDACYAYDMCYSEDCNSAFYGILVADSSGYAGPYAHCFHYADSCMYEISDTAVLYYVIKATVMGEYHYFDWRKDLISYPDSIYKILKEPFYDHCFYAPFITVDDFQDQYNKIDSLYEIVSKTADFDSYLQLRSLEHYTNLIPTSIEMANKTHNPIACFDVYYNSVNGQPLQDEEFEIVYKYLCEAADSLYYPAMFIKAGLCLTGAYFPPDTILGKKLLEQCHIATSIPFWQQYYKPVVYQHLLQQ